MNKHKRALASADVWDAYDSGSMSKTQAFDLQRRADEAERREEKALMDADRATARKA